MADHCKALLGFYWCYALFVVVRLSLLSGITGENSAVVLLCVCKVCAVRHSLFTLHFILFVD